MSRDTITALLLGILLVGIGSALLGCARSEQKANDTAAGTTAQEVGPNKNSASPSPPGSPLLPITSNPTVVKPSSAPSPTAAEVNEAVDRVFKKVAIPETTSNPIFVTGDFNGDGAEDLAVVVKPSPDKLADMNNEFSNWTLEDPKKVFVPRGNLALPPAVKPAPVRAEKGDTLLAVIHGVGPQGWRNADAKQTFVLKNGAGTNMATQSMKSLREGKDRQKLPPIRGDAIREALGGSSGLLVWTGAKYGWYSPDHK